MTPLAKLLEAALFAAPRPIALDALAALDPDSSPAAVSAALDELREHYDVDGHGVELVEQGGGWQILTRAEYAEAIERAQVAVRPTRLSAAALDRLHERSEGNAFYTEELLASGDAGSGPLPPRCRRRCSCGSSGSPNPRGGSCGWRRPPAGASIRTWSRVPRG